MTVAGKILARRCYWIFAVFTIVAGLFLYVNTSEAAKREYPFQPGEKLVYQARWGFLKAGRATLEVLPITTVNGVKTYHFVMETETNPYVDIIYRVRERQDSFVDLAMKRSVLYKKRSEGNHPRDVVVHFSEEKKEATYSNFGEPMQPVKILSGTFDPLALFFVLRVYELKENKNITIPISDGKKMILARAKVIKKERLKISGKEYDTFFIQPEMESLGSVFKESEHAGLAIWYSADTKKIPVRIVSKVGVGMFTFELMDTQSE